MTLPTLTQRPDKRVLWAQVWGLATVQGAISLMWVIYNLYLVDLLGQFGFPQSMAAPLLIVENLLAMVMEPLMGSLSDRVQHWVGSRFPLVSIGVILAAGIFIGLPMLAFSGLRGLRSLLPLLLIAWALAMTVFRSPALSLLSRYAFRTQLPQAASVLTLVGGVAGAMGPLAGAVILGWGAIPAFALGSGVLLLAAIVLRSVQPNHVVAASATLIAAEESSTVSPDAIAPLAAPPPIAWRALALVFGAGVGISLGFRLLMRLFSTTLTTQLPEANTSLILGCIFIALAVTAIPAGQVALRMGNRRAMMLGLGGLTLVYGLVSIVQHSSLAIVLAIAFGAAFSLVSNGTIPFALSMVPASKAGLGTGMFFSGGAAAASVFGTVAPSLQGLPPALTHSLGAIAFLLAGVCVAIAPRHLS